MRRETSWFLFILAIGFAIGCSSGSSSVGTDLKKPDSLADTGPGVDLASIDVTDDPGLPPDPGPLDVPGDPGSKDSVDKDPGGKHHPAEWMNLASQDFHGRAANQGLGGCTSCHGGDLTGGAAGVSCETCHGGWKANCTFCHGGTDNDLGSPPESVSGGIATSEAAVGAHTSHLEAPSGISTVLDCSECHIVPVDALTPGHLDPSPAEVVGHGWDHGGATCTSSYCHGDFSGGNANHPKWTTVDGTQAACGSCHALPPKTGKHPSNYGKHSFFMKDCSKCHEGVANNGATSILDPTKHVNGAHDVKIQNGSWNSSTKSCNPACHGSEKW